MICLLALGPFLLEAQQLDYQINAFAIPTHSATWARMCARESSQEIDAVYYNPAGVSSLKDGFHVSFLNQSQWVRNKIVTHYEGLNQPVQEYPWEIDNFLFPELFLAWKRNKLGISGFITPALGGGGSTSFSSLPVGEMPIADLTSILELLYAKDLDYNYDFNFSGFGYAPSFQLVASYQVTPAISIAGGVRYSYFITKANGYLNTVGISAQTGKLNEIETAVADLISGLIDVKINAKQSGHGFTPIIGLNYNYKKKVYLSGKYEFKTPIKLTTKLKNKEGGSFIPGTEGVFVHNKKVRADLPPNVSVGVRYVPFDRLTLAAGTRYFFFKNADWNGREKFINKNYKEFDIAAEVTVGKKERWKVSGGYSYATMDIDADYQNDVNFFMPSHTMTIGGAFRVSKVLTLEAGLVKVFYVPKTYYQDYEIFAGQLSPLLEPIEDLLNTEIELPSTKVRKDLSGDVWVFAWSANIALGKKDK